MFVLTVICMASKIISVPFTGEYITLGQFLKKVGLIDFGGEEKAFLSTVVVYVNGMQESRRGRKLRDKDLVNVLGCQFVLCSSEE